MAFSDEIDISLRPSKSTEQTQLDALRDVNVQIFPRHMTCLAKPNLVTLNLFKCLPDLWKAPDIFLECRDDVSSHMKYYQLSSEILEYKLFLFHSGHFGLDMKN